MCLKWLTTRALRTCEVECGKETDLLFYVHVVEVYIEHWHIKQWKWRWTARNRKADTDRCSRERKQKHTHTSVMMERFDCGPVSVRTFRGSLLPQARTLSAGPLPSGYKSAAKFRVITACRWSLNETYFIVVKLLPLKATEQGEISLRHRYYRLIIPHNWDFRSVFKIILYCP